MLFKKYSNLVKIIFFLLSFIFAEIVYAQNYVPLVELPGVTQTGTSLGEYIAALFNIGIGLAVVLTVLMIVIAGVELIGGASSPSVQKDARNKIQNALLGLLLAMSSWLIVYTINPQLIIGTFELTPVVYVPPVVPTSLPAPTPNNLPLSPSLAIPTTESTSAVIPVSPIRLPPPVSESQSVLESSPIYSAPVESRTASDIDTSNDFNMVKDCISGYVSEVCDSADLDSNGVVNSSDLSLLVSSWKYNTNGDDVVNFAITPPITSCFLKVSPVNRCIDETGDYEGDSDGVDDRWGIPCYSTDWYAKSATALGVDCASDRYGDLVMINENLVRRGVTMFTGAPKISLGSLFNDLFRYCDDSESPPCYNYLYGRDRSKIIYYTFANFDTDSNKWADFTGQDTVADFNGDGIVNDIDSRFVDLMRNGVGTPSGDFVGDSVEFKNIGIPPTFSVNAIEALVFDGSGFTDREVVEYCIGKPAIMGCASSDLDASCLENTGNSFLDCLVTQDDLNKFDIDVPTFDINGDGIVNFKQPS